MMCTRDHRHEAIVRQLPQEDAIRDRPRCACCAYEVGFQAGLARQANVTIDLAALPPSADQRQSPHMAWALGYLHGVMRAYSH